MEEPPPFPRMQADLASEDDATARGAALALAVLLAQADVDELPAGIAVLCPRLVAQISRPTLRQNALAALSGLCKAAPGGREAAAAEGAASAAVRLLCDVDAASALRVNAAELCAALASGGGMPLDAVLVEDLPAAALAVLNETGAAPALAEAAADCLASCAAEPGAAETLLQAGVPRAASLLLSHPLVEVRVRLLLTLSMLVAAPGALAAILQTEGALRRLAVCAAAQPAGCDEATIAVDMLSVFQAQLAQRAAAAS